MLYWTDLIKTLSEKKKFILNYSLTALVIMLHYRGSGHCVGVVAYWRNGICIQRIQSVQITDH